MVVDFYFIYKVDMKYGGLMEYVFFNLVNVVRLIKIF